MQPLLESRAVSSVVERLVYTQYWADMPMIAHELSPAPA